MCGNIMNVVKFKNAWGGLVSRVSHTFYKPFAFASRFLYTVYTE